jgi:hypothetical protein
MIAKGVRFNAEKKQVGNYYSTKVRNSDNWFQMLLKFLYRKLEYNKGAHSVICMIETYPHLHAYAFTCFYIQVYTYARARSYSVWWYGILAGI